MGTEDNQAFREEVRDQDRESVRRILSESGFFFGFEIETALECVNEHLARGLRSGYHFLFSEQQGTVTGFTCFGPIACTQSSYDLYWIAVDLNLRGHGLGRVLLEHSEAKIRSLGGTRLYVETSSREQYHPTHMFYRHRRYRRVSRLKDFYAPGDDKIIYLKLLVPGLPLGTPGPLAAHPWSPGGLG